MPDVQRSCFGRRRLVLIDRNFYELSQIRNEAALNTYFGALGVAGLRKKQGSCCLYVYPPLGAHFLI